MSKFFINRPNVAIVIAILMVIVGAICLLGLPIAQYPNIAPPEIQILTHYTGADALTIEQSVAAPIHRATLLPVCRGVSALGPNHAARPEQLANRP